jgi:hypothetical protein
MRIMNLQRWLLLAVVLWLAGCAGTIQRESQSGAHRIENARYSAVDVVLTDDGRREAADNPLFNVRELGDYVRRRLEGRSLLDLQGTHRVEVSIQHVRVRSALSAVMLGIMAGSDSIEGYVRVYDQRGRQVHGYKVNASYGLGGLAGGQDSTRLGWLYDKFSDLAVAELSGATEQTSVAKGRARPDVPPPAGPAVAITPSAAPSAPAVAIAPVGAAPAPALSAGVPVAPAQQPRPIASGFAAIDDVDAVPYLTDRGRQGYREWLEKGTPRAFALSSSGHWASSWGLKPADPSLPVDPAERALASCERTAKKPCRLYAVNRSVVWTREPTSLAVEGAAR